MAEIGGTDHSRAKNDTGDMIISVTGICELLSDTYVLCSFCLIPCSGGLYSLTYFSHSTHYQTLEHQKQLQKRSYYTYQSSVLIFLVTRIGFSAEKMQAQSGKNLRVRRELQQSTAPAAASVSCCIYASRRPPVTAAVAHCAQSIPAGGWWRSWA